MSLEAIIQENTNAIRELIAAIQAGVPTTAAQVAAVVTEAKAEKAPAKKETAKAEEKKPAAGAAPTAETQPSATTEAAESSKTDAQPEAKAPTYQATADAITKLARTKGRDAAIAVLTKFGASKLPDIQPNDFQKVIDACAEAMQ